MIRRLKAWQLAGMCLCLSVLGCKDDNGDGQLSAVYDPSQPVTISSFTPESGGGNAQLVIYGSNFGSDVSQIRVTVNDKESVVISSNGHSIYCFVPRQAGVGPIKVIVGPEGNRQEAVSEKDFLYEPQMVVKTLIGWIDEDGNSSIRDGDFETAQFQAPYWLQIDGDTVLWLLEDYQGLRKIDLKNEKVTTLWRTGSGITHPRSICFNSDHSELYIFNDQDSKLMYTDVTISAVINKLRIFFMIINPPTYSFAPHSVQKAVSPSISAPQLGQVFSPDASSAGEAVGISDRVIGLPHDVQKRMPRFTMVPQFSHRITSSGIDSSAFGMGAPQELQKAAPLATSAPHFSHRWTPFMS